jgi:hypothetical protein
VRTRVLVFVFVCVSDRVHLCVCMYACMYEFMRMRWYACLFA